jgi:hypothetical protein
MTTITLPRATVEQALEALEMYAIETNSEFQRKAITALRAALAQQAEPVQEPDLSRCPQCNGPADNGHDRSIPPNPYLCTKCMAEMPQPSYNVTVVDDAHPNGIPLEQWQNKPVKLTPWRCACGANLYIGADGAPRSKAEQPAQSQQAPLMQEIARLHDRVKDLTLDVEFLSQPPQRKPLSLTDLQEALVLTNLIDRDAIEDPEGYDKGSTLAQIDELHRIIKERV